MGRRTVFQNGKEMSRKNSGKAENSGDTAYFILKRTDKSGYGVTLRGSGFFPSFPSFTWERELICNGQDFTRQPLHQGLMPSDKKRFQDIFCSAFLLISPLDSGKFPTKGLFLYLDHIGNLLEIKEFPNNGKLAVKRFFSDCPFFIGAPGHKKGRVIYDPALAPR